MLVKIFNRIKFIRSDYKKIGRTAFKTKLKNYLTYKFKMRKGYYIHKSAILKLRKNIEIGRNVEIQEHVIVRVYNSKLKIGDNTQINPFTVIYGCSDIYIGKNVMIAPHCMIVSGNHDYKQLENAMRFAKEISKGDTFIGDDVWIGANCTITDGVRIGAHAIVAANSVVLCDIEEYDVYAGTPAKLLYNRKIKFG